MDIRNRTVFIPHFATMIFVLHHRVFIFTCRKAKSVTPNRTRAYSKFLMGKGEKKIYNTKQTALSGLTVKGFQT